MSILLVSASFGGVDKLKPLPEHDDNVIRTVLYTDTYTKPNPKAAWSSIIEPDYPRGDFNSRLRSQYFKQQIHRLDGARDAQWLVWADASLYFIELDFLVAWAEQLSHERADRRALFIPHPQRKTIGEEAIFIQEQIALGNEYVLRRYTVEQTQAAMHFLVNRGCLPAAPLYCGGLWMVENSLPYWEILNAWWDCTLRYGNGAIDQLALGGLLHRNDIKPHRLEVDLFSNQHFLFVAHP